MAVEKEIIVALEFGSSKIRGIAGCKNLDGSVQLLAVEEMDARACIRKGMVYNIDKTVMSLRNIVEKFEQALEMRVKRVFLGIGGMALKTRKNVVSKQFTAKAIVTQEMVDELLETNANSKFFGYELLQVVPQEYRLGTDSAIDPIGILSDRLEGTFLNIMVKAEAKEYMLKCLEMVGLQVAGILVAPLALSAGVLTDTEKRLGCAMVDFGFGTTTVTVYKNNLLRHLAVIPLGGNNITSDICSLQIEEEDAENLKLKHGCAYTERKPGDVEKNLLVNNIRTIEEKVLMEIVETRQEEILNNVLNQIRNSGFEDGLQTGLVISGGASNMMQLEKAIAERIHPEKTRFVKLLPITMINDGIDGVAKDGTMNILLALLNEGNMNCVEPIPEEIPEQADENPIEENIEVQEEIVEQNPTQEDVVEEDVNESELNHTEIDEQEEDSSEEEEKVEKTPKESAFKRWFKRVLDTVSEE